MTHDVLNSMDRSQRHANCCRPTTMDAQRAEVPLPPEGHPGERSAKTAPRDAFIVVCLLASVVAGVAIVKAHCESADSAFCALFKPHPAPPDQ